MTRRIYVQAGTPTGNVFSDFNVLSNEDITLDANAGVDTGTATNGSVSMASNSMICGNIQYGVGEQVTFASNAHQCTGYTNGPGTIDLPLVNQGDVATNNSNGRFFTQDLRSSTTRVTYTASTRTLQLNANSSLTLGAGTAGGGPGNYSLCRLVMASNTTLYIAAGANVRIYFDSPENCNQPDNTLQMDMSSNSNVLTTGGSPATATFLFVGSQTLRDPGDPEQQHDGRLQLRDPALRAADRPDAEQQHEHLRRRRCALDPHELLRAHLAACGCRRLLAPAADALHDRALRRVRRIIGDGRTDLRLLSSAS